jgi:hypothetical protein
VGNDVTDPLAEVAGRIRVVRGQRVMFDTDLAQPDQTLLSGCAAQSRAVVASLRSQSVTLKTGLSTQACVSIALRIVDHGAAHKNSFDEPLSINGDEITIGYSGTLVSDELKPTPKMCSFGTCAYRFSSA